MKKLTTLKGSAVAAIGGLLAPWAALAQSQNPFESAQRLSQNVGNQAGVGAQQDLPIIIGRVINILLGFLGIVLLFLILWAGFSWMTAGGNAEKVQEARTRIINAVIGLIIVVAAFAISNFVLGSLVNVTR